MGISLGPILAVAVADLDPAAHAYSALLGHEEVAAGSDEGGSRSAEPLPVRAEPLSRGASAWTLSGPFGLRLEVVARERHV